MTSPTVAAMLEVFFVAPRGTFLSGEKQEILKQDIIDGFIKNRNPPALKTYKEEILKNCQNEHNSKNNSSFFLKFQVDSAPKVRKKIARTP
jgi:hypothetical protein